MQKIFSIILALIQSILLLFGANGGNESAWQLESVPAYDGGIVCKTVYNAARVSNGTMTAPPRPTAKCSS